MTRFVRHLVDQDRPVQLFIGDQIDTAVVDEIRAAVPSPLVTTPRWRRWTS